jgi:hypothetical protein
LPDYETRAYSTLKIWISLKALFVTQSKATIVLAHDALNDFRRQAAGNRDGTHTNDRRNGLVRRAQSTLAE